MNSTDQTSVPVAPRPRRPRLRAGAVAALAAAGLAAAAGCTSGTAAAPAASATPTQASITSSPPVSTLSAPASITPAPPSSAPPPSAPAATPVLGQVAGDFAHGTGFGQVRPPEVFNGGDPTGLVTKISWSSWGGITASGSGTGLYVAGNQPVAAGTEQPVTIVAFKLGTCDGKLMYQAVEWYFPQHGQSFSSARYENVCTGTYVPAS
jgi:hypothetical protein